MKKKMELSQLKTFEDACKLEGIDPKKALPQVSTCPESQRAALLAIAKLMIIVSAANRLVNDGKIWLPDWSNYNEYKYYTYFEMRGSSGFLFNDCAYWNASSCVGSRLAFKTAQAAVHVGKTFEDLYRDFMVIS